MAARLSALNPSYSPCASSLRHSRRNPRVSAILAAPSLDTPPHKNIALVHKQAPVPAAPATTTTTCQAPSLARLWREIQGAGDWEGLVEPLHPLLRSEIVRYGEFVLACYKTFDLDPASKRYLNCKHGKRSMLREVGLADFGYDVTKYIYATPDIAIPTAQLPGATSSCSRWIGYVAVASDETSKIIGRRDIVVSFRGTVTRAEWIANFMSALSEAKLDPHGQRPGVKVESGFLSLYTSDDSSSRFSGGSCREQLLAELARLLNQYKDEQVSITLAGHSMGSALALLSGYDLAELGLNRDARGRRVPVTVYSFGGPRVGNAGFKARCEELGVKVLRVVNVNDPVTKLPGVIFNEGFRELAERFELPGACACYAHVGVKLAVDFFKVENPGCVHDLDAYVGLLRSPKMAKEAKESGVDFLSKAAEMLRRSKVVVDQAWRWQDAALHVGNLMLSLNI